MKREIKCARQYMICTIVFIIISALAIGFIPSYTLLESFIPKWFSIIISLIFWGFLIAGYVCLYMANKHLKRRIKHKKRKPIYKYGIIRFFRTIPGGCADVFFIASVVMMIVVNIIGITNFWILSFLVAAIVLSIQLHAILNGEIYSTVRKGK